MCCLFWEVVILMPLRSETKVPQILFICWAGYLYRKKLRNKTPRLPIEWATQQREELDEGVEGQSLVVPALFFLLQFKRLRISFGS